MADLPNAIMVMAMIVLVGAFLGGALGRSIGGLMNLSPRNRSLFMKIGGSLGIVSAMPLVVALAMKSFR